MKKILILCGGSGPQNLLEGLQNTGVMNTAKVQVLINALDNGLSTGQCRQIFGGKLLGPSDVRKNAMTRYKQLHGDTPLAKFLNERFDCASKDAKAYVNQKLIELGYENCPNLQLMHAAADYFFAQPLAQTIDYNDFSMSNLIYSGVAALNGLSLYKASQIIAKEILNIEEDFVLLNSDESVFINAVTASGKVLTDEVDIDEWDHIEDRIESIFFTDPEGKKIDAPVLHPDADKAIKEADIIIYSSGTQWTSLIPTYATTCFDDALAASKAKQYLVMNNIADTDMTGMTSADIIDVLAKYLPMKNINVILNSQAQLDMTEAPTIPVASVIMDKLSQDFETAKHDGNKLVDIILDDFFKEEANAVLGGAALVMDYDDTLVGRNSAFKHVSARNLISLKDISKKITSNMTIVTGNSIRCIDAFIPGMHVIADNSCNEYICTVTESNTITGATRMRYKTKGPVKPELLFSQLEVDFITKVITEEIGIDISKVTNKAFAGVGIKPVASEYRKAVATALKNLIDKDGLVYEVLIAGRTTIDIYKKGVSKMNAVGEILRDGPVVYIGDEWQKGNDKDVYQASLRNDNANKLTYVTIEDPSDTALFFKALLNARK